VAQSTPPYQKRCKTLIIRLINSSRIALKKPDLLCIVALVTFTRMAKEHKTHRLEKATIKAISKYRKKWGMKSDGATIDFIFYLHELKQPKNKDSQRQPVTI
jgi:hypothetical protein